MAALIDDDVLGEIAVVAPPAELAARIRRRCAAFADRVSLVAPYAPQPDRWVDVVRALKSESA
jgi:hypothetical protein